MSRAFTLAGVAIAVVALAGTADQARATFISATLPIAGKIGHDILKSGAEAGVGAVVAIAFEKLTGVRKNGEPVHTTSPSLALQGKSLTLDVQ